MDDKVNDTASDPAREEANLTVEGLNIPPRGDLIREIKALVEEQSRPQIIGARDPVSGLVAPVVLLRDSEGNERVEPLDASVFDEYLDAPRFRRGTARMTSIESLIAHTIRFKDEASAVFACDDRKNPSLTAVLDYHPANETKEGDVYAAPPRFGRHRSTFAFPVSDEWKAWADQNAKPMSMAEFAEFLEDRIVDVAAPGELPLSDTQQTFIDRIGGRDRIATPTELIELSRGLRVNENAAISNSVNLASGEGEISFATEHTDTAGRPITIPTSFQIAIPVFRNDALYPVVARLRYRVRNGLVFWYELFAPDRIFDDAFDHALARVGAETGLPIFRGAPEA